MENKEYQEIFDATRGLGGKELEEKLLSFAGDDQQMKEELIAMFARIDTYHEVIQSSKEYKTEEAWIEDELQSIADTINAKSKEKVTTEDVKRALGGDILTAESTSNV